MPRGATLSGIVELLEASLAAKVAEIPTAAEVLIIEPGVLFFALAF
mgnify:CR=1 FL=1